MMLHMQDIYFIVIGDGKKFIPKTTNTTLRDVGQPSLMRMDITIRLG